MDAKERKYSRALQILKGLKEEFIIVEEEELCGSNERHDRDRLQETANGNAGNKNLKIVNTVH